jgi:DHA1 family bicyclomycin/chloramphenicol resistance-like MFS transporter
MAIQTDDTRSDARPALGLVVLACLLSTFPSVTGDIYLPALPQLTGDLGGTAAQGQQTLAGYFLGLGLGQLFYGPVADRLGRRPVMIFGAALYVAATIGCFLVATIGQMIALRFLQALAACSGVVISSAIVRDRFSRQESARVFSMLLTARSLGPLLAPILGGALVALFGWRGVFGALAVFGAAILLAVIFGLRETRPQMVAEQARSESPMGAYRAALSNRTILGYLATNGFNFGIMFAWITVAPFLVIEEYGVPEVWFGWIFAILALALIISAQLNRRLVRSHDGDAVIAWGAGLAVIAACALLLTAATGFGGLVGILVPLFCAVFSLGLVSTNAMAGALAVDPARTGSVSALVGTSQFGFAALVSWLTSHIPADPALAMAIVICGCAAGAIIYPAARLLRRAA